jgi:predicted RNase H-like nuclease
MNTAICKLNDVPLRLIRSNLKSAIRVGLQCFIICLAASVPCGSVLADEPASERPSAESAGAGDPSANIRGVALGQYRIRSYYPVDAQKSTVRFVLYAAVKKGDLDEAQRLVDEHLQKLRDQVITATRLAPIAVFQEPDLSSFRRRVYVRLRRALPELAIEDLYISDFDLSIKSL